MDDHCSLMRFVGIPFGTACLVAAFGADAQPIDAEREAAQLASIELCDRQRNHPNGSVRLASKAELNRRGIFCDDARGEEREMYVAALCYRAKYQEDESARARAALELSARGVSCGPTGDNPKAIRAQPPLSHPELCYRASYHAEATVRAYAQGVLEGRGIECPTASPQAAPSSHQEHSEGGGGRDEFQRQLLEIEQQRLQLERQELQRRQLMDAANLLTRRRPSPPSPILGVQGFYASERTSGMNKICYYNTVTGTRAVTVGAMELCPVTLR